MKKVEARWFIAVVSSIFGIAVVLNILREEGGFRYYLHKLDAAEILGTVFVSAVGTLLALWHSSTVLGLLFALGLLIALSRAGRLRGQLPAIGLFLLLVAIPCLIFWSMTRQHLSLFGGLSLSAFWLASPVLLYLCIRHAIIRRDQSWTSRDRLMAYFGVAVALLMLSLSTGTLKSDAEVQRSLDRGREVVYAIKHYQTENKMLPETLQDLVPGYFRAIPETDVPEGWSDREDYIYTKKGTRQFAVSFEAASYINCNYERSSDTWECS
ncbi:MAG: hypothetical protein Q8R92_05830 [Deltaproteobacteria bacterium]|nr:hypothetical protein [Deltaproteobacteria bacterium]